MARTLSGKYAYLQQGIVHASEYFKVQENGGGGNAVCSKKTLPKEHPGYFKAEAILDREWRILELKAQCHAALAQMSASYHRQDGGWSGAVSRIGQDARECHIPLAEGLEVYCPSAFFDTLLFKRLNLPQASQIRVELVEMQGESLDMVQSYRIIERLDDEPAQWLDREIRVSSYRVTDPFEVTEQVCVHPAGASLLRKSSAGEYVYRLLEFSEESG